MVVCMRWRFTFPTIVAIVWGRVVLGMLIFSQLGKTFLWNLKIHCRIHKGHGLIWDGALSFTRSSWGRARKTIGQPVSVEIRARYIPNARQKSYLNELFRWLGLLQVIWRSRRLVTKAVVFRRSQRYSGLRLCGLLRCVGCLGSESALRINAEERRCQKESLWRTYRFYEHFHNTDASDLGDSFCCHSHWEAFRRIRNAFSYFVVRQS